jgi:hypothetical protein
VCAQGGAGYEPDALQRQSYFKKRRRKASDAAATSTRGPFADRDVGRCTRNANSPAPELPQVDDRARQRLTPVVDANINERMAGSRSGRAGIARH